MWQFLNKTFRNPQNIAIQYSCIFVGCFYCLGKGRVVFLGRWHIFDALVKIISNIGENGMVS